MVASLVAAGFELLPITPTHAAHVLKLPLHHRGPFDRLLVSQAQREAFTLMTRDAQLAAYDIDCRAA